MTRILGTMFAGLLGLAFGSFLNVCVSRWPKGVSVVQPRSFCEGCGRTLAWWENVPLVSWIGLRGRCRTCGVWIGWQTLLVELAVGGLWAAVAWDSVPYINGNMPTMVRMSHAAALLGSLLFYWLLVALAALDAEEFWLPDWITLPGVALGIVNKLAIQFLLFHSSGHEAVHTYFDIAMGAGIDVILAGGLVLVIRWIYWLVKRREGIGLGDAKLMAMLGAWLGIEGALLAFGIGVVLGAVVALAMLARHQKNHEQVVLAATKLPLGTFLCIGGIVSGLWGDQIVMMYLRWAGF